MAAIKRRFCAAESLRRAEPFLGTASVAQCFLLVEYRGDWPNKIREILERSTLGDAVTKHLQDFIAWCPLNVKVLLIKGRRASVRKRIYLFRADGEEGRGWEGEIDDYSELLTINLKEVYELCGRISDVLVVCTHGKRDKCCAKFGLPIYRRLCADLKAGEHAYDVWECSHVGGDRFAANVVWFPHGLVFGHVQRETDRFVCALAKGRVPLDHLRGRSALPSAAQYFEGVVRKEKGLTHPTGVEVVRYAENERDDGRVDAYARLRFRDLRDAEIGARVIIRQDETTGRVLASCNSDGYAFRRVFELFESPQSTESGSS